MKIKTFNAPNYREALAIVRKELGDKAVILSSKENTRGVEVAAAVDYPEAKSKYGQATSLSASLQRPVPKGTDGLSGIRNELQGLKNAIMDIKKAGFETDVPEDKREIYGYLTSRSIAPSLALTLAERAKDITDIPQIISGVFAKTASVPHVGAKAVMMVGPTGVGKTTTVAKLAAKAVSERKRTAVINLDTYRIGAVEQMRIYTNILGIPFETVSTYGGLRESLLKHSAKDMVFIDTTGRNPFDGKYINELASFVAEARRIIRLDVHLLMNASGDAEYLSDACRSYGKAGFDALAFSKIDEAVRFGPVFNLTAATGKPVAYITTGQRVPEDISFPDSGALSDLVLGGAVVQAALCGAA